MLKVARFAFGAWILVEILSWIKVLPLTLEFTWFGLILTASFAWGAIEFISWRLRKAGAQSLWGGTLLFALVSQCADAFGDIFRLYGTFGWYDQVAHVVGGAAVALIFFNLLTSLHNQKIQQITIRFRGFIAVIGSMAVGSLYEIEEYSEDVIRNAHRLGDAFDTANDMFCNTIGAVLLVIIIVWTRRKKQLQ
jgi:hypothetical protein